MRKEGRGVFFNRFTYYIDFTGRSSDSDFGENSDFSPFGRRVDLTFLHVSPILTLYFVIYRRAAPKNAPGGFCEFPSVVYNITSAKRGGRSAKSRRPDASTSRLFDASPDAFRLVPRFANTSWFDGAFLC